MDVSSMIGLLGLRLEDAEEHKFTATFKTKALNNAQLKVSQRLKKPYLTELQYIDTTKSLGGVGYLALSDLTYDVLNGAEGILKVRVTAGGKYCQRIDINDLKKTENTFLAGTVENPLYYVFRNRIYVIPDTIVAIDVFYLKVPTDMFYLLDCGAGNGGPSTSHLTIDDGQGASSTDNAYGGATPNNGLIIYSNEYSTYHIVIDYTGSTRDLEVSPAASSTFGNNTFYFVSNPYDDLDVAGVKCQLNPSLHELVVTMAEAEAWAMDSKIERFKSALEAANLEIELLNQRYVGAQGIGTKGDKR